MFVKRDTPSPGSDRSKDGVHCDLCGSSNPAVRCDKCNGHSFCLSCDDMYHRHPKRKQHLRKAIDAITAAHGAGSIRTPLPPGHPRSVVPGDPSKMPIPPPRKKKGRSFFPSFGSRNDEIPALPKKEFSITEKLGSIRRFMSNRPLPPTPKDEVPLKGVLGKPPGYPPDSSPMSDRRNMDRMQPKPGSPQYQNIMAHLTKVAQNSADEWEEDPSVSTSGSTRGSSGGDDVGWGQEFNTLPKGGGPPILQHRGRDGSRSGSVDEWQRSLRRHHTQHASFRNPEGSNRNLSPSRMQQSTSMVDLQGVGTGVPSQQPISPSFYPAPYPHFYAPPPGMAPQGYPGGFANYPSQYYRGSWSNLRSKEGEGHEENEEGGDDNRGTLTHKNQNSIQGQMKRSQSVMYDPMMVPNAMFPFGAYPPPPPGYPNPGFFPPYWAPQTPQPQRHATPPSPTSSVRSLNRMNNRERSRKHYQQQRVEDESASSSGRSRESARRRNRGHIKTTAQSHNPQDSSEAEASSEEEPEKEPETKDKESESGKAETGSIQEESDREETRSPVAPPPIPTDPWECSFCTFINPAGTRVCSICCKTISSPSTSKSKKESPTPSRSSDGKDEKKTSKAESKKTSSSREKSKEEVVEFTPDLIKEQEELEKEIRRQIEATRKLRGGSPGERGSQISLVTEATTNREEGESSIDAKSSSKASNRSSSPIFSSPIPDSELHFQTRAISSSKRSQVTTSTSPIITKDSTEFLSDNSRLTAESVTDSIKTTRSNEQLDTTKNTKSDSSCQTYDTFTKVSPIAREASPVDSLNATKVEASTSPPPPEMHSPNSLEVPKIRKAPSQSSLKDEVSFPNPTGDRYDREFSRLGPILRSLSRASLTSEPAGVYGGPSKDFTRGQFDFDQQRRFGGSDWRKRRPSDLATRNNMSKSQVLDGWNSGPNQRGRQEQNYRISMEDLVEKRRQETMRAHGLEMVRLIRKAEQSGFLPDDLQVALSHCSEDQDPIDWLEENWGNMVETVVSLATNFGHEKPENDVGIISAGEAKEALRITKGNIWASVTECVESRQRKFIEMSARGDFTRREIIAALTANNGNMELSYSELTRKAHKPYTMNVWGPGSGQENLDNKPGYLMPEYNRQPMAPYLEPFDGRTSPRMPDHFLHRKGNSFGEGQNIHRSMLNLNIESEFKPLGGPGYTPSIGRRYSFASGQIQRPTANYSRYQPAKSNYDASDTQSNYSEDLDNMTISTRGRSERPFYGMDKSPKSNKRRSTSFLDKLATLRKERSRSQRKLNVDADYDYDDQFDQAQNYDVPEPEPIQEQAEAKPQKKSFLNRLLNRPTPPRDIKPVEVEQPFTAIEPREAVATPQNAQSSHRGSGSNRGSRRSLQDIGVGKTGYGSNLGSGSIRGSRKSLTLGELDPNDEASAMEKVQAFLDVMPEDTPPVPEPVKEKKTGFLSRLGFLSSKKDKQNTASAEPDIEPAIVDKAKSPEKEIRQSSFSVEDETIFDDQDLTLYQGFIEISDVVPVEPTTAVQKAAVTQPQQTKKQPAAQLFAPQIPKYPSDSNLETVELRPLDELHKNSQQNAVPVSIEEKEPTQFDEPEDYHYESSEVGDIAPEEFPIAESFEPVPEPIVETIEAASLLKSTATPSTTKIEAPTSIPEATLPEMNQEQQTKVIKIKTPFAEAVKGTPATITEAVNGTPATTTIKHAPVTKVEAVKQASVTKVEEVKSVNKAEPVKQDSVNIEPIKQAPVSKAEPVKRAPVNKAESVKQAPVTKVEEIKQTPVTKAEAVKQAPVIIAEAVKQPPPSRALTLMAQNSMDRTKLEDEPIPLEPLPKPMPPKSDRSRRFTKPVTQKEYESAKVTPTVAPTSPTRKSARSLSPPVSPTREERNKQTRSISATQPPSANESQNFPVTSAAVELQAQTNFVTDNREISSPTRTISPITTIESPPAPRRLRRRSIQSPPNLPTQNLPEAFSKSPEKQPDIVSKSPEKLPESLPTVTTAPTQVEETTTTVRRRQRPKPVEVEETPVETESPKNLPAPSVRRRRSFSTERSNPIRVRPTSMSLSLPKEPENTRTTSPIDYLSDSEIKADEKSIPDATEPTTSKPEGEKRSRVSRTPETSSIKGSTATNRVRRQRSVSRDRNTISTIEPAKPAKEAIAAASANPGVKFHYLKSATGETLRPKGTFATKRQSSKDGGGPSTEPVTSKAASKTKEEPKKLVDGPAVNSRRIALDNKIKELQAAGKCSNYEQAEMAARLMEMNFDEDESIHAAKECGSLYQAISFLQQDCELCAGKFPVADMVSMVNCTHRACKGCLNTYFTLQIRDRNILELLCPFCNEPDLTDDDIASDYFNHMDMLLKNLVDNDSHDLFHRKLRDRALMRDPLFRWCSQCSSGFIITNPNQKRLLCPDCKAVTCASCRKRWEKQHEGISCEQFLAWKEANDPEVQAAGLAQHLAENGIDCPSCNFRYSLAKGGCMHFRCVQCQFDFCSGCGKPFRMGTKCGVSEYCEKLGLHAHHPRNCLFYLRDKEPEELQKLLDENKIKYNQEPPEGSEVKNVCQVNEQKETNDGFKDDICGKDVMKGYAGLCRVHYLEYLGGLITKHNIDPVNIFNQDELELVLRRSNLRLPPKFYRQKESEYRADLLKIINENLPLGKIEGE